MMKMVEKNGGARGGPLSFEHDGIPTFEECRQLVRERAYELWADDGRMHGFDVQYWAGAERQLFGGMDHGGYRIYVRDVTKPKIQDFYHWYCLKVITPDGPIDPTWEPTWRTSETK